MRLFAAVPLSGQALDATAAVLSELRSSDWPVRWVGETNLHITVKFFGEVLSDRIDTIGEMMEFAVAGVRPFSVVLNEPMMLPSLHHAKVVAIRVDSLGSRLELIQDKVERGGIGIGFSPEGRAYIPHVTLGRVKEGQRLPKGGAKHLAELWRKVELAIDRVVLFESILAHIGPRYEIKRVFALEP